MQSIPISPLTIATLLGLSLIACGDITPLTPSEPFAQQAIQPDTPDAAKETPRTGDAPEDSTFYPMEEDALRGDGGSELLDSTETTDSLLLDTKERLGTDAADAGPTPLPEPRACSYTFRVALSPGISTVQVPSSLNEWSEEDWALTDEDGDSVWEGEFDVSSFVPGPYPYKLLVAGTDWIFDPSNPEKMMWEGVENSRLLVPDCALPRVELVLLELDPIAGSIELEAVVRNGIYGSNILTDSATLTVGGKPVEGSYHPTTQRFSLSQSGLANGKHSIEIQVSNEMGSAEPLLIPFWVEPTPFDWADASLYFAMVDRFSDGQEGPTAPDCLPEGAITSWNGGDWKGLQNKIESQYFSNLGIRALWITSPMNNPEGCFAGTIPGQFYTSYHGYFPTSFKDPEERHGSLEDLRSMVDAAHAAGIRVIADLVLNHVHDTHPLYANSPDWFFPSCLCGSECDWNTQAIECWFESYLPDFNYLNAAAVEAAVEVAKNWMRIADFDGYRVDAVKHMHDHLFLSLRARLEDLVKAGNSPLYLVGETFTGDWGNGTGGETLIKPYISQTMLHGQFDFPLYWQVVRAFARNETTLAELGETLMESTSYYGGVMSSFLGNHDVPRFISHAAGHIGDVWGNGAKEQGLQSPPPSPTDSLPYEKLRLAQAFLYAIPGIPLTYYGDEIGLPGAGDPDNRRMMFFDNWTEEQATTYSQLSELGHLRNQEVALRRGSVSLLASNQDGLVLQRTYGDEVVLIGFNRSAQAMGFSVEVPNSWTNDPILLFGDGTLSNEGGSVTIEIPPNQAVFIGEE